MKYYDGFWTKVACIVGAMICVAIGATNPLSSSSPAVDATYHVIGTEKSIAPDSLEDADTISLLDSFKPEKNIEYLLAYRILEVDSYAVCSLQIQLRALDSRDSIYQVYEVDTIFDSDTLGKEPILIPFNDKAISPFDYDLDVININANDTVMTDYWYILKRVPVQQHDAVEQPTLWQID